ncbi:MAG: glycoside hydrolase family 3 protein [Ruminococcus sp.]|nr:glycoside hydrolase family 3 protein [Ruminococcus sp.]
MKNYMDTSLSAQERAELLCDTLTVEEMASQLKYDAPEIKSAGLPFYNWWNEGLHGVARAGVATMFPQAIGLSAMFCDKLVGRVSEITSEEARAKYNASQKYGDYDIYKGLTMWAPNINIFRDPRWGRGHETYGEDPYLTSKLGVSFVKGMQGDGKYIKTAACAKHFAVHSGPESVRHHFDAVVSKKDMEETYLPAFESLVKAGVEGVMGAYNRVNGEVACASEFLMGKLKEWGFDGYFVSDCWAVQDFHLHHNVTKTPVESAALALKMGCDINCGSTYIHILSAYEQGLVTVDDIRKACVHALRTRIRLGQLDKTEFDNIPYNVVSCDEHKNFSQECAEKSMVLLKNNGILPLNNDEKLTIAVIGPNADSRDALTGNYNGTADRYVTFLEGIQDKALGRVIFAEGCQLYKDRSSGLCQWGDRYAEAVAVAECSDVIIACVGLDATLEGEEGDTGNEFSSGDKKDLRLPESQRILLEKLKETGKPLVIVNATGSSVNVETDCDALLQAWYPGQYGGKALANILFGEVSPSGKLPVTFYKSADMLPDFEDYSMKNRTYRYCDSENVLYPFGFGLSYGNIICENITYADGVAEVTVKNVGKIPCEDVIELYIKGYGENYVKNHNLCGFMRVFLNSGEEKTVKFEVSQSAFESVNEKGERIVEGNKFTLYAGTSQPDELSEKLSGKKCVSVEICI